MVNGIEERGWSKIQNLKVIMQVPWCILLGHN